MDPLRPGDPREAGAYRLEGRLGAGGMGQVYLGRSPGGRPVAVKVVHPALAGDAAFRRRFAREVEAARKVSGFYTAQVVDADTDADPPWLATAYIDGPSLRTAVQDGGTLPAGEAAALGAGLAEGLAAIHACDLVHRDLTPGNVILSADGPRVIDFGIVQALDAATHSVSTAVLGTPGFISPEQVRGGHVGTPADVFAFGSVLAFACTGRTPFGTGRADAILYRIVHDEPDLTGVPAELSGLVAACLRKDPAARPELLDVLTELAATTGPRSAGPRSAGTRSAGPRSDHGAAYDTVRDDAKIHDGATKRAEHATEEPPATRVAPEQAVPEQAMPEQVAPEQAVFALDARTVRRSYGKAWAFGAGMFAAILNALVVVLLIGDLIKSDGASSDDIVPVLTVFVGGGLLFALLSGLIGMAVAPRPHRFTLAPDGLGVDGPHGAFTLGWDDVRHISVYQAKVVAWFPKHDERMRRLAKRHRLERHPIAAFPGESLVGYVVYNSDPASLAPAESARIEPVRTALIAMAGDRYATP